MFMLTHTFFLQKVLKASRVKDVEPDIYVYNVAPDLLAIHPQITPAKTHILQRNLPISFRYPKSAYVLYHLLIDDLSHHGYISSGFQEEFNLDSRGYSYMKGNRLVHSIIELHNMIGKKITYGDAVYRSHLIIEMIYDLVIMNHIDSFKTIDVLVNAVDFTRRFKMKEFIATINALYGIEEAQIDEVMKGASLFLTKENMENIMNIEGRIHLYKDKFGLQGNDQLLDDGLKDLFQQAMESIDDDELFFQETTQIIKNFSGLPFII